MVDVAAMIESGAIRIVNSYGYGGEDQPKIGVSDLISNQELSVEYGGTLYDAVTYILTQLASNSESFASTLSQLSSNDCLLIDCASTDGASGNHLNGTYAGTGVRGIVALPLIGGTNGAFFITGDGSQEYVSFIRMMAHEISHAILDNMDPEGDLNVADPDYRGGAVDFENTVAQECYDNGFYIGSERLSYFNMSYPDVLGARTDPFGVEKSSWTDGREVDLVIVNANYGNYPSPGPDIDTSSNTETVDDLILDSDFHGGAGGTLSHSLKVGNGDDFVYGFGGDDTLYGGSGNDYLDGGSENDQITGGDGHDVLIGGKGADYLYGGAGEDLIVFDADDLATVNGQAAGGVNGGDGIDIAWAISESGVTLNLKDAHTEIAMGSAHDDTLTLEVSGQLAAGGAGNDTIDVKTGDLTGPVLVWGGAGSDVIDISFNTTPSASEDEAVGILVVNVDNISEQNFHNLTYDMLGMGDDFEWSEIDVVMINPDSSDRINIKDNVGTQQLGEQTITREQWFYPGGEEMPQHYYTTSFTGYEGWIETDEWAMGISDPLSDYRQSFLSGYDGTVYGPANTFIEEYVTEYRNSDGTFLLADTGTDYYTDFAGILGNLGVGGSGSDGEIDTEYDLSGADAVSDWVGNGREHYFYGFTTDLGEEMDPITAPTGWFMVGGHLSGDSVVLGDTSGGGVIHVQIPDTGDMVMV